MEINFAVQQLFCLTLLTVFFTCYNFAGTFKQWSKLSEFIKIWKMLDIPVFLSEKRETIMVVNVTTTSILLKWKLHVKKSFREYHQFWVEIQYRPNTRLAYPPTIIWNNSIFSYEARSGYGIHDIYSGGTQIYDSSLKEIFIQVDDLPYPGINYEFKLKKYFLRNIEQENIEIKKVFARTSSVIPKNVLKTGSGCFHIYNVYNNSRRVKIYWQRMFDHYEYEVTAFEEDQSTPIFTEVGNMEKGFLWCVISLKHHRFLFKTYTHAGVSKEYSIVDIPAQSELLPQVNVTSRFNQKRDLYIMTWEKPEGDFIIDSYSVFWIDTVDKKACLRISDVIFLSPDETSFEIRGKEYVGLALSVNSISSSSGLQIAKTYE